MLETRARQGSAILIVYCVALVSLAGCAKGLRRVPANGSIELDGHPMKGGIIFLNPDTAKGNTARVSSSGRIRDGRFQIETAGVERHDSGSGVPLGWYKVYVRVNTPGERPMYPGLPEIAVDPIYRDPQQTPLAIEIVDNPAAGAYDLKLTSTR
jgi:hypothetical protein